MTTSHRVPVLNERAQHLFRMLVERYIRDGQPVGSRVLSRESGLDLSPATVRNVMADLEDLGLLRAPHTSAGRVPTVAGYRLFVDTLLRVEPLDGLDLARLRAQLDPMANVDDLLATASSLLSDVTRMAGVVMLPRQEHATLRHVEFVSLSDDQVLVILVVNAKEVQNRIIRTGRRYSQSDLQQAANYLNALGAGKDLPTMRELLVRELESARESMNEMMAAAIEMANQAFAADEDGTSDYVLAGQTNLMNYGELAELDKLRDLFEAFRSKTDILHLLDQSLRARGVQIFIGEESGHDVLDDCSVVTSPYGMDGETIGVLGVIGPQRMAYDRVIPIVDVTARLLGAALTPRH